tara:strand:- start:32 stop:310 length:279 start_codon:yes stop_codon:yes gene_type:complete
MWSFLIDNEAESFDLLKKYPIASELFAYFKIFFDELRKINTSSISLMSLVRSMLLNGLLGGIINSNELKKSGDLISSFLKDDPIKIGKIATR